jgi:hypothetical protein
MTEKSPPSDIQNFLDMNERLPGELVLGVTTYGPSSTLIVTDQRIIGKTQDKNPHTFQGSIKYPDVIQVHFTPGLPVVGAPSLHLEYRIAEGKPTRVTFHFPGRVFGNLLYRLAGYDPREIYLLILEQVDKTQDSARISS